MGESTPRTKVCKRCNTTFTTTWPKQLFCSKKCRQDFFNDQNNAKRHKSYEPKPCLVCGAVFTPIKSISSTCSKRCRNRLHLRRKSGLDVRDITSRVCPWCSADFVPTRCDQKYCSQKCWYLHTYRIQRDSNPKPPSSCIDCGKHIEGRGPAALYCKTCHKVRRISWHEIALSKKPVARECKGCGKVFDKPQRQVFCSRMCMGAYGRSRQTEVRYERICTACGEVFTTYDQRPKQCGTTCAQWARNFPGVTRIRVGICGYCEQPFKANKGNQKYCSARCTGHVSNSRRRAAKLGLYAENVSRTAIAERDKWICQLCGKRVNKQLRAPHPLSASLDHIIPIALGGEHTRANCQLAHLGCNCSKGARIREPLQLALIG